MATATDQHELTTEQNGGELSHAAQVEGQRAMAEIQAAMTVAYKNPRDETRAYNRIMTACKRMGLAENSQYTYPKGGQKVTGPSIRLAEVLAQCWGNIDFGIKEVERRPGESVCIAYCWDLETNTRQVKEFHVPHYRDSKKGRMMLSDSRDIYEMVANMGARRLRACILGIIPGDIVDEAIKQCEQTLKGNSKEPLKDRVRKMVDAFADQGVTHDMIATRLGHVLEAVTEQELADLRKIYVSLKDGMSRPEQWFSQPSADEPKGDGKTRTQRAAEKGKKKPPEDTPEPSPEDVAAEAERNLLAAETVEMLDAEWEQIEPLMLPPKAKSALLQLWTERREVLSGEGE